MNDIDIIKKAVSKKHRCDPVHEAIERIESSMIVCLDSLDKLSGMEAFTESFAPNKNSKEWDELDARSIYAKDVAEAARLLGGYHD